MRELTSFSKVHELGLARSGTRRANPSELGSPQGVIRVTLSLAPQGWRAALSWLALLLNTKRRASHTLFLEVIISEAESSSPLPSRVLSGHEKSIKTTGCNIGNGCGV